MSVSNKGFPSDNIGVGLGIGVLGVAIGNGISDHAGLTGPAKWNFERDTEISCAELLPARDGLGMDCS